jgi:alkylation response protein AidB-like acyl-CoA dehydrogenase
MNVGFTEEQELLRDTARKFFERECPASFVRVWMAEPQSPSDEFWQKLAAQGWLGIIYPEELGGSGLSLVDLVVLMEEMGRVVMPGPFLATVLLAGGAIFEAGSSKQRADTLPRIASGALKASLAFTEPDLRWDARGIRMPARAEGAGFRLNGQKLFVADAHAADLLVVAARTHEGSTEEEGVSLFLVPKDARGLSVRLLPSIDETRKLYAVDFADVVLGREALLGPLHGGWPALERILGRATVALSAEMCAGAERVLAMTADYAKLRVAFGKPIGSYQGVKHRAADMLIDVENAKSLTYYAAWAFERARPDAPLAISMAKASASDAYRRVAGAGIQLHGGIGFTWEHDLHLYYRRAKASEVAFGDASWHRERVARLMSA